MSERLPDAREPDVPSTINVLIVDDLIESLRLIGKYVSLGGFLPYMAENADDAMDILEKEEIHLIVSDALMPKTDGFQLCRMIKSQPKFANIPFFIFTGDYIDKEDEEFGRSIGVDRYIHKSDGFQNLINEVNKVAYEKYGIGKIVDKDNGENIGDDEFIKSHYKLVNKKLEEKINELEEYYEKIKQNNVDLLASENRYRSLFDNASVPIIILNKETGKVVDVNSEAEKLFQYNKEELMKMPRIPFIPQTEEVDRAIWNNKYYSGDMVIENKNGEKIDVHITTVHIYEPAEPKIILYIRDDSESKKIKKRLLQIEKMALMGRLAAGIAHEIRNPLASVIVNLQYLQQKTENLAELAGLVDMAFESALRIEQVIEKTLSLAKPKPPSLKKVNLNDIIVQTLGFMKIPLRQKNVSVDKNLNLSLPQIYADGEQIQQVLLNVFHNALDAVPSGGDIRINTKTSEIGKKNKAGYVFVEIGDSGIGIGEDELKNIFDPFYTTKRTGTGLGLAISKYIMEKHKGDILVESVSGKGTTVTLKFIV